MKKNHVRTRRIHIPITQEIINNAVVRDSSHCVIADAIRAAIPEAKRVAVDLQTIRFTVNDERVVYLTPAPQQTMLVRFDQGQVPTPGDMYLSHAIQRVPAKGRTKGNPQKVKETKVTRHGRDGSQLEVTVEGGRLPPTAALSNHRGRRRTFGLRTLEP
jgi:hypothetical protein